MVDIRKHVSMSLEVPGAYAVDRSMKREQKTACFKAHTLV